MTATATNIPDWRKWLDEPHTPDDHRDIARLVPLLLDDIERLHAALVQATAEALYGDRVPDAEDYETARRNLRESGLLPPE